MSIDERSRDRLGEIATLCAVSTAQVLAEAVVSTISACGEGRVGLGETQKAQLIECALLAYDGHRHRLLGQLSVDEQLRQTVAPRPGAPTLVPVEQPDWAGGA